MENLQLEQAGRRLNDSQSKLARLRSRDGLSGSRKNVGDSSRSVKEERKSPSPVYIEDNYSRKQSQSKPQLIIPALKPKIAQPVKLEESSAKPFGSVSRTSVSSTTQSNGVGKQKGEFSSKHPAEIEVVELQAKGRKRKLGKIITYFV